MQKQLPYYFFFSVFFFVCYTLAGIVNSIYGQSWNSILISGSLQQGSAVDAGDINNDGCDTLDVVCTDRGSGSVIWFEAPNWNQHYIDGNLSGATHLKVVDLDFDNDADVVAAGYFDNDVVWYENDGATQPTWTKRYIDFNLTGAVFVDVSDLDNDGDLDVVASGHSGDIIVGYTNNGGSPITWTRFTIDSYADGPLKVLIANINNDTIPDVVAGIKWDTDLVWYEGPNWTEHPIDGDINWPDILDVDDIDGDDYLDVVSTEYNANDVLWYKNEGGSGTNWQKDTIDSNLLGADGVSIADFNNDNKLDVVAGTFHSNGALVWYQNDLPNDWPSNGIANNLKESWYVCSIDMDNDGDNDVLNIKYGPGDVVWYENPLIIIGIDYIPLGVQTEYDLHQNYPNPFNPSTAIEFDLPKTSEVSLKVFNILGEEVITLVSDRLSAGSYSYKWDASNLASGIYLYRLKAGDYVETRKMILMR